jgi:hypothetical protein
LAIVIPAAGVYYLIRLAIYFHKQSQPQKPEPDIIFDLALKEREQMRREISSFSGRYYQAKMMKPSKDKK